MGDRPLDALRAEIRDRLTPQGMRLLCGEMSTGEMRTARALMKWVLRMCDKHEPDIAPRGIDPDLARLIARSCVARARRAHPDSISAAALQSVEDEIDAAFSAETIARHRSAAQGRQEGRKRPVQAL